MSSTESAFQNRDRFHQYHENHGPQPHPSQRRAPANNFGQRASQAAQSFASQVVRNFTNHEPARIALITQIDAGLQRIREQLFDPTRYMVREVLSLSETRDQLSDTIFDILILRIPFFSATHVQMAAKVRAAFPRAGIIACCAEVDPMARFQARNIPMMKVLTESHEIVDLTRVIEKLRLREASGLRQHVRNRREGEAEIVDGRGVRLHARFCDFGQMGARMTVRSKELLQNGDRVRLDYRSSQHPERVHRIEAQVAWQVVGGTMMDTIRSGPLQTVGLRFIGML